MSVMWMWGILGLVLLSAEMVTGTLYILWFGIAAILLSVILWLFPEMSVSLQLFLYAVLALGSLFVWRHFYEKNKDDLRIGQSQGDEIGRTGIITEAVNDNKNGKIEFAQGVMGSRSWAATADEPIAVGNKAIIVAVEGNTLKVKVKID